MRSFVCAGLATLAFCAPATSAADDIYKSTMRDGSVRYGEAPEYGAKRVKKMAPPPTSTGTITVTAQEQAREFRPDIRGAVTLPPPPRKRPEAHQQGRIQAPQTDLASRTY